MEHTLKNKKGMSMIELIAYVALYGVVMSLLASLVFVIVTSARKVNAQSIINRGATMMYTEILAQTVNLNPDYVEKNISGDVISITFKKVYYYEEDGTRKNTSGSTEYSSKTNRITYSYEKNTDKIDVKFFTGSNTTDTASSTSTINLNYKMTVTSHNSTSISDVFSIVEQNKSNSYVTFHGDLHYDNKTMEFNFVIPVFTYVE